LVRGSGGGKVAACGQSAARRAKCCARSFAAGVAVRKAVKVKAKPVVRSSIDQTVVDDVNSVLLKLETRYWQPADYTFQK
jgi:hypothetical protein